MAAYLQTTFWNAFSLLKIVVFWFKFQWSVFPRVLLTTCRCDTIFSPPYILTPGWKYRYDIFTPFTIFSPPSQSRQYMTDISFIIAGVLFHPMSSSMGVNIVPRCIHPSVYFHWSDYIVPRYIQPHSLILWEWLYHATIYPTPGWIYCGGENIVSHRHWFIWKLGTKQPTSHYLN